VKKIEYTSAAKVPVAMLRKATSFMLNCMFDDKSALIVVKE
jgi:hypothetical protein